MNDLGMRMFLRTTMCFTDIGTLSGKDITKMHQTPYSGNHLAIFECELKSPPQLSFVDETEDSILNAYRMNFKNWKIVDIDNFMGGNSYFSQIEEGAVWKQKVAAVTKTEEVFVDEKSKSPTYVEDVLLPRAGQIADLIEGLDTKSNRKMSPLHKERQSLEEQALKPKKKK